MTTTATNTTATTDPTTTDRARRRALRRGPLVTLAAAGMTVLAATSATAGAELRGSLYAQCRMPRASDPLVRTLWVEVTSPDRRDHTGPWEPYRLRVACESMGCDPVDTILLSVFDATTSTYRGGYLLKMPKGFKTGDVELPPRAAEPVRRGHTVRTVVTLQKSNGRYCTVVNTGFAPRG